MAARFLKDVRLLLLASGLWGSSSEPPDLVSFLYARHSCVYRFLVHLTGRPLKQLQRPGLTWGRRALELVLSISLAFSQTHELKITF